MNIYFAPMQGVTDSIFRQVHHRHFSGATKYFIPFVSPGASLSFTRRERFELSPVQNADIYAVPQILCSDPDRFNAVALMLRDSGYPEVNLNLGCPSSTVTAKGRGSGLLKYPDRLKRLLDGIFSAGVMPVSVKTRIGYESPEEWEKLIRLYEQYPLLELIVHPRTRQELYGGSPHREICLQIARPYIFNGDLFTRHDAASVFTALPHLQGVMLGRGLAANPALAREISGGNRLTAEELLSFHDDLYTEYLRYWPESTVVGRMHLIMKYLSGCFDLTETVRKKMKKASDIRAYNENVHRLFSECTFKTDPAFCLENLIGKP